MARKKNEPKEDKPGVPLTCAVEGAALTSVGYCEAGQGYALSVACPFACPYCRQALKWTGDCSNPSCHGCASGAREDWTIPGDRYELRRGHWVMVERGPRTVCTVEQNKAATQLCVMIVTGEIPKAMAKQGLASIFGEDSEPVRAFNEPREPGE